MPSAVSQRIKEFNADRLPDIVQRKYEAMAADPFHFYRATCHLFYEDLTAATSLPVSPPAWLCGDLHPENFGSYKGDNRQVYFDISDFDEGVLGPALWDVTRMATGILVMFDGLALPDVQANRAAANYLSVYAATLTGGKAQRIETATANGVVKALLENVVTRKREDLLEDRVKEKDGMLVFKKKEKQLEIEDEAYKEALLNHAAAQGFCDRCHEPFEVLDACFRIAGTGSLGLKRYLFLLQSPNKKIILDMKETKPSSLLPYVSIEQPFWSSEAERVVRINDRMQDVARALLTATVFNGVPYKIQEMQPSEDKVEIEKIKDDEGAVSEFLTDAAVLTASAQLRSAGRDGSAIADELIAFGKAEEWKSEVLRYANIYSKKVKQDYNDYRRDFEEGFFE